MDKYFTINENKCSIHCRLFVPDSGEIRNVVISMHGFAGSKDSSSTVKLAARMLPSHKTTAVLTFDWPCHGSDSSPKISLSLCSQYLNTVLNYTKEHFAGARLYATGISFGGYLLLKYIAENGNPFVRIALRSPAVVMYSVLTETIMNEPDIDSLKKNGYAVVGFDKKIKISAAFINELHEADLTKRDYSIFADELCLIHGKKDEIVPFEAVENFAEANGLLLLPVEGADHRFVDKSRMSTALSDMIEFLDVED